MAQNSFLAALGPAEYFALILAAAITLVFVVVRNRPFALRAMVLAAFLPLPVVALFSSQHNLVGWHGFMHASAMYQIMDRGVTVPEEPFYAGASLRYPWVEHWLLAKLSLVTGVHPLILGLIVETAAYLGFLAASGFIASKVSREPVVIGLAVLLSGFGISVFHSGLFAEPTMRAFPPLWLESRVVPLDKYLNFSTAPLGIAAMTMSAAAALEVLTVGRRDRRALGIIFGSTLVAALIHPLSWLGLLVYQGIVVLLLLFRQKREPALRALENALAVGIPSVVCLPYLRSLSRSESSDGWMGITESSELFFAKLADLGFFLAAFALLLYLYRAELTRRLRSRDPATLALGITAASFAIAYLVVRLAGRNEYKFLLYLVPAAAPFMALALLERIRIHPVLGVGLLFLLLVPGARQLGHRPWFEVTDPARTEGRYHRALDPAADALYQWVSTKTPKNAVFLAADLRTPALGRRSQYVAVEMPWRGRDGWGLPAWRLLQWHVRRPDRQMYQRQHLATVVLNPNWAANPEETMAAIQRDVPGRPLYVHAAYPAVAAKLEGTPGFTRRYANSAGSIFSFDPKGG